MPAASTDNSRATLNPANLSDRPHAGRTAAALFVAGSALGVITAFLHPHTQAPNDHLKVFAEYAASHDWEGVHDLQYGAAALVAAGFVALYHALTTLRPATVLDRIALAAASVTAGLIGVNMAVDGIALRHAVSAWVAASPGERAERFAAAEAIRWLEWGANSLFLIQLGVTVVLFAVLLIRHARRLTAPTTAGLLAGTLLAINGYHVGGNGFTPTTLPLVATALFLIMALGAWRLDTPTPPQHSQ